MDIREQAKKLYEDLRAQEDTLKLTHPGIEISMNQKIAQSIWNLNVPPDPDCPNARFDNFRGKSTPVHEASMSRGRDVCLKCFCRAEWIFFGRRQYLAKEPKETW